MAFSMGLATRLLDLRNAFGLEDAEPHRMINSHNEHKMHKVL